MWQSVRGQCTDLVIVLMSHQTQQTRWPLMTHNWQVTVSNQTTISNTPPQAGCSLSELVKCFALMLGRAFVSMSAVISSVGQYTRLIIPFCTINLIKWYLISMCLVRAWYDPSFVSAMADCESEYDVIGLVMGWKTSPMIH